MLGGWCAVYRKRPYSDTPEETYREVSFAEYSSGKSTWAQKPATMINKVAVSQCLREAFPNEYAGIYADDELIASGKIKSDYKSLPSEPVSIEYPGNPLINDSDRKVLLGKARTMGEYGENVLREIMAKFGFEHTTEVTQDRLYDIFAGLDEAKDRWTNDNASQKYGVINVVINEENKDSAFDIPLPWENPDNHESYGEAQNVV